MTWDQIAVLLKENMGYIVGAILMVLGWKGLAAPLLNWLRQNQIRDKAEEAYYAIDKIARKTEMTADDKVAAALGLFIQALDAAGIKATDKDKASAQSLWTKLHEQETKAGIDATTLRMKKAEPKS